MDPEIETAVNSWLTRYGADELLLGGVLCDDHPAPDRPAIVHVSDAGTTTLTYAQLSACSMRLAGSLRDAGVAKGDRVAVMLPKSPELVIALAAILRLGAAYVPLFTAFGPDAAGYRIAHSGAMAVITDSANRDKLDGATAEGVVMICVARPAATLKRGDRSFDDLVDNGAMTSGVVVSGDDLLILLYTSGTTGQPKGVEVPVRALASIHAYMRFGLDLRETDIFWNFADPGWAYGLWYGVIGALLLGQTMLLRGLSFEPEQIFSAITDHGVTNLAGAPTAYRALRSAGVPPTFRASSRLRAVSSAGEPLNAELLDWSARELGVPIHDHYGQSEIGMVVGFAQHELLRRSPIPGSMGSALPGFRVVILDDAGHELEPDREGEVAIDVERSSLHWFRAYFNDPERTAERFRHGPRYYLTADTARIERGGLFHFGARADDVITSSGYRIGPFEVESALIAHAAVAEVAVVGTPDVLRGEAVTAFVVLNTHAGDRGTLTAELQDFVKTRLAKHLYPRNIVYVDSLPRTPSGKVQRNVLRARWQPPGSAGEPMSGPAFCLLPSPDCRGQ